MMVRESEVVSPACASTRVDTRGPRWHSVGVNWNAPYLPCLASLLVLLVGCTEPDTSTSPPAASDVSSEIAAEDVVADTDVTDGVAGAEVTADSLDASDVWPDVDSSAGESGVALTDNEAWTKTLSALDPWWGADSAEELCEPADFGPETTPIGVLFDVDTSFCGYITVDQTLLAEVPVGELFRVKIVQYALTESEGPYLLAIAIGEPAVTVWEMTIEVPSDFQVVDVTWEAARTYLLDEPVYFHLSNHGENTWSFVSLTHEVAPE